MKICSDIILNEIIAHINPLLTADKEDAACALDWEIEIDPVVTFNYAEPDVGIFQNYNTYEWNVKDELHIKRIALSHLSSLGILKGLSIKLETEILTLRITAACEAWLMDYEED